MAQRGQGTYPDHTGGIRAGNKERPSGRSIYSLLACASYPGSGVCQEVSAEELAVWECPGQEDPVVGACPLGQVWPWRSKGLSDFIGIRATDLP